jgi:thiol-disulfide isomerase/thioredoxin
VVDDARAGGEERLQAVALAIVVIGVLLGIARLPRILPAGSAVAMEGKDAPDIEGEIVANGMGSFSLAAQRGRPVLLDFWATWCPPCRAEAPVVSRAAERYKGRAAVVGVDTSDAPGKAAALAAGIGITFPVVYDDADRIAHAYGVSTLPTLVLVSRDGKILATRTGLSGDAEIDALMKQALGP